MKTNPKPVEFLIRLLAGCALLLAPGAALPARGDLAAPDNILYGTVVIGSNPVTSSATGVVVEARRANGLPIARYRMGEQADAGNFYALTIKLEELPPQRDASSSVINETLTIVVISNSVEQMQQPFTVAERGQVTRLDFGILPTNVLTGFEAWAFSLGLGLDSQELDPDGDGISNDNEYVAGTHPADPDSKFLLRIASTQTNTQVSFNAVQATGAGYGGLTRHYALERLPNLIPGNWNPVPGYSDVLATDQIVVYGQVPETGEIYFFRGKVWLQAAVESEFRLMIRRQAGTTTIAFPTLGQDAQGRNRYYTLEQTSDLNAGSWTAVPGISNVLGNFQTVTHAIALTDSIPGFFRGRVEFSNP